MKMDGWQKSYSRDRQTLPCMNNAYYICTIMRLEYDATLREDSYKRIARSGFIEGSNTFIECVTLSLVAILIEHSTPEWHQKLQEVADDLRLYAGNLYDRRKESARGFYEPNRTEIVHLIGVPTYLSKDLDDSWVLPDELFQPRTIDDIALLDMRRQDPTFNWDKHYYHHDEEDIREMLEKLGKTQQEKATLIYFFWRDIYYSRKEFNMPINETWLFLKKLAQEFCPDYMEETELHKIPANGIEFEKRITELEAEVTSLEQQLSNVNKEASSEQQTKEDDKTDRIIELEKEVEGLKEESTKLNQRLEDEEPEKAFNATCKECFSKSKMGLLIYTIASITDGPIPVKKNLVPIISSIGGWEPTSVESEIKKAGFSQKNIDEVAEVFKKAMPNLASKIKQQTVRPKGKK